MRDWAAEKIREPLDVLDWDDYSVFQVVVNDAQADIRRSALKKGEKCLGKQDTSQERLWLPTW